MSAIVPDPTVRPTRVWLEPGYDGGDTGAWLLDLPGCFVHRPTRAAALEAAPATAAGFVDLLARHGERLDVPTWSAPVAIVEEVPARKREDGAEVNATFSADHRPVEEAELEACLRWLDYARTDLQRVADRVARHESTIGPLDPSGGVGADGSPGRDPDAVLRHLAGSEIWLGSRLDPSARFEGPPRDGDLGAFLDATRAWALVNLRRLRTIDPGLIRTDSKGETWTLAKVLRRYVYHSLDHLAELERRLAEAASSPVDATAGPAGERTD